ncbi:nicotinate-nucleotide adenylyltransferase [Pseudanabaena sp. PCC 6802]|uniref:nicotinate-nucleotide adenylyltransferase n=1 Tax=Pseudanabaena sp. PCC 6802 TaxID=118173 RepID=UPI00034AD3AC|nr:nicotinate-nucleotide adenylyltransferase [Pseudanabaena sp. PCC 6802]
MKISLFGTSADPPTLGHQAILKWLCQHFDLCVVWVSDNPFKSHQASLEQRIQMMELAIASMQSEYKNLELHPDISHPRTLITLQKAKVLWPNAEFTLVVGGDLIAQLPSWYRSDELLAQVDILVVPRAGYDIPNREIEQLKQRGVKVAIAEVSVPMVSSSAYRKNGDRSGIVPSVSAYIDREHLYSWQETKNNTL